MLKKLLMFFLTAVIVVLSFAGCSADKPIKDNADIIKEKTVVKQTVTAEEFDELLLTMPLAVTEKELIINKKSDEGESLDGQAPEEPTSPDMLKFVVRNNTDTDIKNMSVAFVGWNENGEPVRFGPASETRGREYLNVAYFAGVNMTSGGMFGEGNEFLLSEWHEISTFKAIVKDFETFDGDSWENPYFEQFCELYEEKEYPSGEFEIIILDSAFRKKDKEESSDGITEEELTAFLAEQPLAVTYTEYISGNEDGENIYSDLLKAVLINNSEYEIAKVTVAFAAWDENNLPVIITGQADFESGEYIKQADFEDVLIKSGSVYEEGVMLPIATRENITHCKAIALSYETVDGAKWENPYFEQFAKLYGEQKLIIPEDAE